MKEKISSSAVRGVLFDLDNTLHDRDEAFAAWARDFVSTKLGVLEPARAEEAVELILALDSGGEGDKLALFTAVKRRFPIVPDAPQQLLVDFFAARTAFMRLAAGAARLFDALDRRAIPWGIVTNGGVEQWDKLRAMRLDRAADRIIVSSEFGRDKPDPSIFLAAAERLARRPDEVLFAGDHAVRDIFGAKQAGMMAAWLHRGRIWPEKLACRPDLVIEEIGDLTRIWS